MILRSLAGSASNFWWPETPKNMTNPDFEYIKHLKNPGHCFLNALYIY